MTARERLSDVVHDLLELHARCPGTDPDGLFDLSDRLHYRILELLHLGSTILSVEASEELGKLESRIGADVHNPFLAPDLVPSVAAGAAVIAAGIEDRLALSDDPDFQRVSRQGRLRRLIADIRAFRFCGPSEDPDRQSQVTLGFRYLLIQLKAGARPLLASDKAAVLDALDVDVHNLHSAFAAAAEVDALLPEIEDALLVSDESALTPAASAWVVDPNLIDQLRRSASPTLDVEFLVRVCREINSCYTHGNVVATALMMRAVLNYVPPAFGYETFPQVVAHIGRSLKDSFDHLENGLRKVADFHTHRRMGPVELYPSAAQVEPFKPHFELLLQAVATKLRADPGTS